MTDVTEFIPNGKENAISQRDLATLCSTDKRTIRKAVECARRHGAAICSDNSGYYFPVNATEAVHYAVMQKRRIRTAAIVLKPVEKYIREHRKK